MRAISMVLLLLLAALATGCVSQSRVPVDGVTQTTRYFPVRGTTLAEIDRDLDRAGPEVPGTFVHHPGVTDVRFDGAITYQEVGERCRIADATIGLDLEIVLPKWNEPAAATPRTRLVWMTLEEDIRRHENHHAAIARDYRKRLEARIAKLKPRRSCAAMEKAVTAVIRRTLAAHGRAQMRFDARETKGARSRLRKLFAANLAKYGKR